MVWPTARVWPSSTAGTCAAVISPLVAALRAQILSNTSGGTLSIRPPSPPTSHSFSSMPMARCYSPVALAWCYGCSAAQRGCHDSSSKGGCHHCAAGHASS